MLNIFLIWFLSDLAADTSYFSRTLVVQEVPLGRKLLCVITMPWEEQTMPWKMQYHVEKEKTKNSMVDRIMAPRKAHFLIPKTGENVTLQEEKISQMCLRLQILNWEIMLGYPGRLHVFNRPLNWEREAKMWARLTQWSKKEDIFSAYPLTATELTLLTAATECPCIKQRPDIVTNINKYNNIFKKIFKATGRSNLLWLALKREGSHLKPRNAGSL